MCEVPWFNWPCRKAKRQKGWGKNPRKYPSQRPSSSPLSNLKSPNWTIYSFFLFLEANGNSYNGYIPTSWAVRCRESWWVVRVKLPQVKHVILTLYRHLSGTLGSAQFRPQFPVNVVTAFWSSSIRTQFRHGMQGNNSVRKSPATSPWTMTATTITTITATVHWPFAVVALWVLSSKERRRKTCESKPKNRGNHSDGTLYQLDYTRWL